MERTLSRSESRLSDSLPEPILKSKPMTAVNKMASLGLLVFCLLLFSLLGIYHQTPPRKIAFDAALTEFSSARAMQHLGAIAKAPHDIGSAENARVRDYLVQSLTGMGLTPQVQRTTALRTNGGLTLAGTVENVVARLPGTDKGKAVLLAAHYDSVQGGPGASDDSSGVTTLLETVRALKAGSPLRNDLIFLFTDGEEVGMLGADAFMAEHPWARDAAVALNFEARGNSGPSVMFETSDQNGWLIREFAQAAPYPQANSLSYDIYRLLPNDTDLTIFKQKGLAGFNFAFIKGLTTYHMQLDNVGNLDERSLQHHGTYALSLARHFGNIPLGETKARNAVYFNIVGAFVHYSSAWIFPLVIFVALVLVFVVVYGLKKGQLNLLGMLLGFLACLITLVVIPLTVSLIWSLILTLNSGYRRMPFGDVYNDEIYLFGFLALTIALYSALFLLFNKKIRFQDLAIGGSILWFFVLILTSFYLPGGSYLFTWPLLFNLLGLAIFFTGQRERRLTWKVALILGLCAAPGLLLFVPLIHQIFTALTLSLSSATIVLTLLLLWLVTLPLSFIILRSRWWLPGGLAIVSFGLLLVGSLTSGFDKNHPEPFHLVYGLNADTNQAIWASADEKLDRWTSQLFTGAVRRTALGEYFPQNPRTFLVSQAPTVVLPAPAATLLSDEVKNGKRLLRLRVNASAQALGLLVNATSEAKIRGVSINGKQIDNDHGAGVNFGNGWGLRYYAPPAEGVELTLEVETPAPVKLQTVEVLRNLPEAPNLNTQTRPDNLMPVSYLFSNSSLVTKSFTF